jgi:hypothetical protein
VSGCATGRIEDLKDCGRLSVGIGVGLDAVAKGGCLAQPSIGINSQTWRFGHENRSRSGTWKEVQVVSPILPIFQFLTQDWGGGTIFLVSYERFDPDSNDDPHFARSWLPLVQLADSDKPLSFNDITDLEAGGTVLFLSVRAGINPLEIVDFLLGFAGLDIAKDDPRKNGKKKPAP